MKKILVITENKNTSRAFTSMLNKNIPFKRVNESPKESLLENDELKVRVVVKDVDIDTFAYDEVLSLTRDELAELQLRNIAEAFVKELSNKNNEEASQLIKIHTREKVLNKEEVKKMMESTAQAGKAIGEALLGVRSSCINCTKDNSKDGKFNFNSIPLQLLSKVNSETSDKEIEYILSIVKNIRPVGFYRLSEEGEELSRIENILEGNAIKDLNECNYKALAQSIELLLKVKDICKSTCLSSSVIGGKL